MRFATLAAVALMLALAHAAHAHPGAPLRTPAQAAKWVRATPIKIGPVVIRRKRTVFCAGMRGAGGPRRFRHFTCLVVGRSGRGTCCLRVHTLRRGGWAIRR